MQTFQKIIRILVLVIIFAIFLIFAMENQQMSFIKFFSWQTPNSPIWILVFISIIIGLILGMALTTGVIVTANQEKRQAQRELKKVKAELNRMRNVSIDEDIGDKPENADNDSKVND